MAFVIPKAQKKSQFNLEERTPGPADYNPQEPNKKLQIQHCAPFNVSNVKTSYFDIPETNYGPGSYNGVYHKDLNKSDKDNENYVFASKVQRFKTETSKDSVATPQKIVVASKSMETIEERRRQAQRVRQSQLEKNKNAMNQLRQINYENRVQTIKSKKQFIRVILTSSSNTEMRDSQYVEKDIMRKTIGPGSYGTKDKKKVKGISKWSSEKSGRFKSQANMVPGPGYYRTQSEGKKGSRESASFASTSVRSYMDNLIYKTNIPLKIQILQERKLKNKDPGPGSYNIKAPKERKSFNYGSSSNFGNVQRIQENDKDEEVPGPGAYQPLLLQKGSYCNEAIKERRKQIFHKKKPQHQLKKDSADDLFSGSSKFVSRKNNNLPYKKLRMCSLEERCFSKMGNMSVEQRFKPTKVFEGPGPGEHQQIINEFKKDSAVAFNSKVNREVFQTKQKDVPYYNLHKNDIGFKADRIKRYLENLKKINVEKSAFQTSSKRFYEPPVEQLEEFQQYIKKQKPEKQKIVNNLSVFSSKTNRGTFLEKSENPGPGQYDIKTNNMGALGELEKKSFNKMYNYHPIKHIKTKVIDEMIVESNKQ